MFGRSTATRWSSSLVVFLGSSLPLPAFLGNRHLVDAGQFDTAAQTSNQQLTAT